MDRWMDGIFALHPSVLIITLTADVVNPDYTGGFEVAPMPALGKA